MASNNAVENAIEKGIDTIIKSLKEREQNWMFWRILFPLILLVIGAYAGAYFNNFFNKEKMLTIPTTVIDRKTGNTISIGNPLPHKKYYEFPITLNDGQVDLRIDQYEFARRNGITFSEDE